MSSFPRLAHSPKRNQLEPPIDLSSDNRMPALLDRRQELKGEIKILQDELKEIDAEVDAKVGNAKEALFNGWRITQTVIDRPEFTMKATSFKRKFFSRLGRKRKTVDTAA